MQPNWQPTATLSSLRIRAAILDKVRAFFKAKNILEIETPLLANATVTDPYIHSFETFLTQPGSQCSRKLYLQTSPEFAMKRLLAAGIGSIYQICKAFRNEECGRLHNPEFTMLEWYRPGFNHHQLMDEMDEFLNHILATLPAKRFTYGDLFFNHLQLDPHCASINELQQCAKRFDLDVGLAQISDKDMWLQLLMTHVIEPKISGEIPVFVYDFPASQAALAKIRNAKPAVAERFEVYINGLEIANGYHELTDPHEQQQRFEKDLIQRNKLAYSAVVKDECLIAALENGFPDCAGVALGLDRLVMLATQQSNLADVISFPVDRA